MKVQAVPADSRTHKLQQIVKWTVYTLLIVNFVFYILEDWGRAVHTLREGHTFLDWTSEFATSIDESAWFLLLFMFELETYILSDEKLKGWVGHTVRGVRLLCYVMIVYTVYAFTVEVVELKPTVAVEGVSDLCMMTDAEVSYVYNLQYTLIDNASCSQLSDDSRYFWRTAGTVVTNADGLEIERKLAWADLIEAVAWLLILLAIETVVRLQDRGISAGPVITTTNTIKLLLYLILVALAVYWATLSHWLYVWDEFIWIAGFAAIEMNIADWRNELSANKDHAALTESVHQ